MAAVLAGPSLVHKPGAGTPAARPRRVRAGASYVPDRQRADPAETSSPPPSPSPLPESLLFDFDLGEDSVDLPARDTLPDPERLRKALDEIRPLSQPQGQLQTQLLRDVQRLKRQVHREEGRHDTVLLAAKLCGIGYRVTVREAVGGGENCLSNLRHTFLFVDAGCDDQQPEHVIVEPHFREHFEISNSCESYREMLDAAPVEFIGTRKSLLSLVALLCHEIAHEFELRGMAVPPWRRMKGMLSKWFPANAKDTECEAPPSTAYLPAADLDGKDTALSRQPPGNHMCADNWIPFQYDRYY